MKKEQKVSSIDLAKKLFADNSVVILFNYKGLNAKGMSLLRKRVKSKDSNVKILKNTLVKRAIGDTAMSVIGADLKDQIAISYSNDPVSLSSVLVKFAEENGGIEVKMGFMDGKILDLSTIKSMSSLGSIEEVRAKFVGLLKAPGNKLARTLKAYEEKLGQA